MAQDLFYTPESSSLVLIRSTDPIPYYWQDVTSLQISGSAYDATVSGSDFGGTAATARIYAYSGSTVLVSFPLEGTNLYYPPFPDNADMENYYLQYTSSVVFSTLNWEFIIEGNFSSSQLSGSGASIYDLTTTSSYLNYSLESSNGSFPLISGNNYLFAVSGSGSYVSYLYIDDTTSGSTVVNISASNAYASASFTPLQFHNYSVTFYVVNPTGSAYLANQYAQCGDCSIISSNVIVQSSVGVLSLLKYYLADDGYAYEILSPTSGSGITTISDNTSYSSCAVVPCP